MWIEATRKGFKKHLMKKILKILYYSALTFIGLVTIFLIFSVLPITGNYKTMVVLSGSMEPAIHTGSIVVVKPEKDYKIGDVITFGHYGVKKNPITHRIHDIKVVSGKPVYITKGDANNAPDQKEVSTRSVLGKVIFDVPYLGYAVETAKKPIGFMLIIIVPATVIVGDEIRKIWQEIKRIKKNKKKVDTNQEKEINELKKEVGKLENEVEDKGKENK